MNLSFAHDLDLKPGREGIDALGSHTVKTAAVLVGTLAEFSARVEIG